MDIPITIVDHEKAYDRPNLSYIRQQLEEAQAAAQTLCELHPEPSAIAPLCEALLHAIGEVSREMNKIADQRG
jgi:ribosomal 50S subunit-associated protein YjgA (DUF615 family)